MDLEVSKPSCNGLLLVSLCFFIIAMSCTFSEEDEVLHLFRKFDANRPGSDSFSRFFWNVNALARDDSVSPEELLAVLQQLSDPADSRGTSFGVCVNLLLMLRFNRRTH